MKRSGLSAALVYVIPAAMLLFLALCLFLHTRPDRLIGAAFCHQIPSRSPSFGFPLCFRCSGLFLGIFWSLTFSLLSERSEKLFSAAISAGTIAALFLSLLDIVNGKDFFPVQWYADTPNIRFLSSFPLGFMLVQLISPIFFTLSEPFRPVGKIRRNIFILPAFLIGAAVSYLIIFSESRILSLVFRWPAALCAGIFLLTLYFVLIKCIFLLRNKACGNRAALSAAFSIALLQICIIGTIHLRYFPELPLG